jgi:hypothetical protein
MAKDKSPAPKTKSQLPELERRRVATQATLDKFKGQSFDWSEGRHCVKLAHFHLRQMGRKPPTLPRIRSALAAKKEMKARGWSSVSEMLDTMLVRIPPAMMLLGDIAVTPGDQGFESVVINLGGRDFLGWLPDGSEVAAMTNCGMDDLTGAWRV